MKKAEISWTKDWYRSMRDWLLGEREVVSLVNPDKKRKKARGHQPNKRKDEAIAYAFATASVGETAKKFKVSRECVYHWIREAGRKDEWKTLQTARREDETHKFCKSCLGPLSGFTGTFCSLGCKNRMADLRHEEAVKKASTSCMICHGTFSQGDMHKGGKRTSASRAPVQLYVCLACAKSRNQRQYSNPKNYARLRRQQRAYGRKRYWAMKAAK